MNSRRRQPGDDERLGRRAFLAGACALAVSGCSTPGTQPPGPGETRTPAPSAKAGGRPASPAEPSATSPPRAVLPTVEAWSPAAGEVEPEVKIAAARIVEALGTLPGAGAAERRLTAIGADPGLAVHAGALVPPLGPSVAEIVYPQYGGLTDGRASVMVVARQTWLADGRQQRRTVTADIRLVDSGGDWAVTELRPAEAVDVSALRLSGAAAALAADPRIALPDAALADLAGGLVDAVVVDALRRLSVSYRLSVCVFRSGHPEHVFGTERISNHARGRAVDVWAIDGVPVVTMRTDDPRLLGFLAAARHIGSDEIGGPVDSDGPGGVHFTDHVHRDHVHVGFALHR